MTLKIRLVAKSLVATFTVLMMFSLNTSPAQAFAGTLENGNLAYAQSEFNKGSACDYLPGFTTGYDAWHFVLTSRGATFQQSTTNPAISVNLNIVYMRQDGSLFVIRSGAWVQTGKGAYTYTLVSDRIRIVQAGSLALINGLDSGMRLSHTCPGSGTAVATPTSSPSPTSTPTTSATPTPTASPTRSATPTPTPTVTPSATPSTSATPTASPTTSATPTPSPASTVIPTLAPRPTPTASAIQARPTRAPNVLPTPLPSSQALEPAPTPTPAPTPRPTQEPTTEPTTEPTPNDLPKPPPVDDPKDVVYVDPVKPTNIDPKNFPDPPASPVVVIKEPTYGDLKANNDGSFTYTPPANPPASPVVDVVEFRYTNLSGEAVIVRREFVMTVKGDVPSIIQTGGESNEGSFNFGFVALIVVTGFAIRRFVISKAGQSNA